MLFFTPPREHFFRPLTHDDRELCAAVLRAGDAQPRPLHRSGVIQPQCVSGGNPARKRKVD